MGSVSSVPSGIAAIAQALGSTNGGSSTQNLENELKSASPADAVNLSTAALAYQQAQSLFGGPPTSQNSLFPLNGATTSSSLLPGVTGGDLANASPDQLATVANQAVALQQANGMFSTTSNVQSSLNLLA